jgi:dihydrofolate reductase
MAKACVNNLFVSLDGFAAGEFVTFDQPIGEAQALFSYFDGRGIEGVDKVDAPITADRALFAMWGQGIGAEIMGRKKFGPQTGPWPDDGWRGWWGEEPPFKTPCFVLTHHPREPMEFDNGTSFHFVDASPADVLAEATAAADGGNVRIGGGPSMVRQFLAASLVDFMHLAIVPVTLGRGAWLWEGLEGLEKDYTIENLATASGLTHQLWNRKP